MRLLEGEIPPLQNEDLFLYVFIIKLLEGNSNFPSYKMTLGSYMLSSDGQILLLQNDFQF